MAEFSAVAAYPGADIGLEIRLFGPMDVRVEGQPLPRLRSRKGLWLLALLALRANRDVERDWLAGVLWPDFHEAAARRSLRQSLHDLRAALGPHAARLACESPRTLRLDLTPPGAWLDVRVFDAATRPDDLENAVQLYRGPLLEDCAEEWVLAERRQREQQYVATLETLAAAARAKTNHGAVANYLRLILAVDPLRADHQRALMESLDASGSTSAALLAFRQFRAHLWRESVEPDAETTALYRRLRGKARTEARETFVPAPPQSLPADEAPPSILPRPRTALIGREEAARAVVDRLFRARLVTLTGTGGVGKTRLSLQVAEEMTGEFADGARFVSFAFLADSAGVAEAVRQVLGVQEGAAGQSITDILCGYLAPRRLLLVLDNCEHVLAACAILADALLTACPGLRVLATSREALGLRGETVWRVPSLPFPPNNAPDPIADIAQYASVRLFAARAQEADPDFQLTAQNAPALARVCRRLDGIPLALELAAARTPLLTVDEIDQRLGDQFRLLTGGERTALPRQKTLRGALDWSWDLLTQAEQTLLARLSVFVGGWTLDHAEAVCVDVDGDVLDLLAALVDKSLVAAEKQANGTTRYRLLETIRQYGQARLAERGDMEKAVVCGRHQDYFTTLVCTLLNDDEGAWSASRDWLDDEQDNLRAALEWRGLPGEEEPQKAALRALELAGALGVYWQEMGRLKEGQERLKTAIAFAGDVLKQDDAVYRFARARALRFLASLIGETGNYSAAQDWYKIALDEYRGLGNPRFIAIILGEMSVLARFQSDYARAQSLMEESLVLSREQGDKRLIAFSLGVLGVVAGDRGNLSEARSFLEAALAIQYERGHKDAIAKTLNNLGNVARNAGDYRHARQLLEQALTLHREMGSPRSIAITLLNLGGCSGDLGDYAAAQSQIEEALLLFREAGSEDMVASALTALGIVASKQQDYSRARVLLKEALVLHREQGSRYLVAETLQCLGVVDSAQGKLLEAMRLWGAVERLRETLGAPLKIAERLEHEQEVAPVRAALGDDASDRAWAEGRARDIETACAQALLV